MQFCAHSYFIWSSCFMYMLVIKKSLAYSSHYYFVQKQKIASQTGSEDSPVERRAKRYHGKKRVRSHSQSPTSPLSPSDAHALGDSIESIGTAEKCTLLQEGDNKEEELQASVMVFPSQDGGNTCV